MLDRNLIDPRMDIDRLSLVASPRGMDHGFDQSRTNLGWQRGIAQALQCVKVHPIAGINGERNADALMQRDSTAARARIVLDIVDDQGPSMQAFNRIADRGGHVSDATGHLVADLEQRTANTFSLPTFEIAHRFEQGTVQEFFDV